MSRRVAELERTNRELSAQLQVSAPPSLLPTGLCVDCYSLLQMEKESTHKLTSNLAKSGDLLKQAAQPHNYLIETIEQRDSQLEKCQRLIDHLEEELANQKQEYLQFE